MAAEGEYESVLCVKPDVNVYRIPPRASNRSYRWGGTDWFPGTPATNSNVVANVVFYVSSTDSEAPSPLVPAYWWPLWKTILLWAFVLWYSDGKCVSLVVREAARWFCPRKEGLGTVRDVTVGLVTGMISGRLPGLFHSLWQVARVCRCACVIFPDESSGKIKLFL